MGRRGGVWTRASLRRGAVINHQSGPSVPKRTEEMLFCMTFARQRLALSDNRWSLFAFVSHGHVLAAVHDLFTLLVKKWRRIRRIRLIRCRIPPAQSLPPAPCWRGCGAGAHRPRGHHRARPTVAEGPRALFGMQTCGRGEQMGANSLTLAVGSAAFHCLSVT